LRHDWGRLSDERPSDVLGALPRRRPHRRSDKRASPAPAERSGSSSAQAKDSGGPGGGNGSSAAPKPAAAAQAQGARKTPSARREATPTPRKAPATDAATTAPHETPATRRRADPRPERLPQPAQPAGVPPTPPRVDPPEPATGRDILGIAAQATAELAEIGLSVSARLLRNAFSRLPRP